MAKAIRDYIRWRSAHTKDPELLALERKHRAEICAVKHSGAGADAKASAA